MNTVWDTKDIQINALFEITQAINNNLSEENLFKAYKFILIAGLKIKKIALFCEDKRGKWDQKICFGINGGLDYILNKEYLKLENERKVRSKNIFEDQFQFVFPVYHKKKLLALVFYSSFEQADKTFFKALTNVILVAIENKKLAKLVLENGKYERELEIAKSIQTNLLPKKLPHSQKLEIEAFYLPHQEIGGDYYDYIPISEDRFLGCVADVSGKGVPAAMMMSHFQASLRLLVHQVDSFKQLIKNLNSSITKSSNQENFITFFVFLYDYQTRLLEYVNCGHNETYLFPKNKQCEVLQKGTTILGMFEKLPFLEIGRVEQLDDFFLFAYTDGLIETLNEKEEAFENSNLLEFLTQESPEFTNTPQKFFSLLIDYKGKNDFSDDVTMFSCKVKHAIS